MLAQLFAAAPAVVARLARMALARTVAMLMALWLALVARAGAEPMLVRRRLARMSAVRQMAATAAMAMAEPVMALAPLLSPERRRPVPVAQRQMEPALAAAVGLAAPLPRLVKSRVVAVAVTWAMRLTGRKLRTPQRPVPAEEVEEVVELLAI
jgi:hypothetical protein